MAKVTNTDCKQECKECVFYQVGNDGHKMQTWCDAKEIYHFMDISFHNAPECKYYIYNDDAGWDRARKFIADMKKSEHAIIQQFIQRHSDIATSIFYGIITSYYRNYKDIIKNMKDDDLVALSDIAW